MKFPFANSRITIRYGLAILILSVIAAVPFLSRAQNEAASITVVNNSSWQIRHLYLSPTDQNNWGPDQLNDAILAPGSSVTINTTCSGAQIKVISEDTDGCFLSKVVDCSDNASWTITDNATPYCGN